MPCGPKCVPVVGVGGGCCPGSVASGSFLLIRRSIGVSIRRSSGSDWGGVVVLVCCSGSVWVCCAGSV